MSSLAMLMREAERLSRPGVLLKASGERPPAAYWLSGPEDGTACMAFVHAGQWYVVVPTEDGRGRCEPTDPAALPAHAIPLYAHPYASLPPIDAIFLYGSADIDEYLAANGWSRDEPFNDNFRDPAAHAYEREWAANCPVYRSDAHAVQGGWHFAWPEGDFEELADATLVLWTLADSEPWIEVFEQEGRLQVIQRIT